MAVKSSSGNLNGRKKGGIEPKKNLKKLTSIRLSKLPSLKPSRKGAKARFDQPEIMLSSEDQSLQDLSSSEFSYASMNLTNGTTRSDEKKKSSKEVRESEDKSVSSSTSGSTLGTPSSTNEEKVIEGRTEQKKILKKSRSSKLANFRGLKPSRRRAKTILDRPCIILPDDAKTCNQPSSVDRATCSSTLKVTKFPVPAELHPGGSESETISVMKVCPYHHCSLHGDRHSPVHSQKSLLSKKSHPLKSQISVNPKNQSTLGTKHSSDKKKEIQTSQIVSTVEHASNCDDFAQANEDDAEPSAAREEKGDAEPKNGVFTPVRSSEANVNAHEGYKMQLHKKKHFSMWNLIHQHMAPEASEEALKGADKKEEVDDGNQSPAPKSPGLNPCSFNSDKGTENLDTINQDIEIRKMFAIKLVREAIEKILLPEVQDQLSDDQSVTSDVVSEHESLEKNRGEDSTNKSFSEIGNNDVGGDAVSDLKEVSLTADIVDIPEEQKAMTKVGNKSDKQTPKSWSNLKKWILLQRFIKALEKVRKLNPTKPRHLSLDPELEADKIRLRRQIVEEKKNTEEWMLDYALQQAISQLAPTQKRKVALLVKAFETVVPPHEDQHIQVTFPKLKDNNQEGSCIESKLDESVSKATGVDQKTEEILASNLDQQDSRITCKKCATSDTCMSMVEDCKLCFKSEHLENYSSGEVPVDVNARPEVHEDTTSSLNSELLNKNSEPTDSTIGSSAKEEQKREYDQFDVPLVSHQGTISCSNSELLNGGFESSGKNVELDELGGVISEPSYTTRSSTPDSNGESTTKERKSSGSKWDTKEQQIAARGENSEFEEGQVLSKSSPVIDSQSDCTANSAYRTQSDKQNHLQMWHTIYQHVVSGIAAKVGTQLLLDGTDEEQQVEDAKISPEIKNSASCHDLSKIDQDASKGNHDTSKQKIEFTKSDAVKLVQEAIDEILLPDIENDSSDTQSTASDIIPDQELLEKKHGDGREQIIRISTGFTKDSCRECEKNEGQGGILLNQEEKRTATDDILKPEELKAVSVASHKFYQQKSKNWSKLKSLILLKRCVKALEKFRKFNSKPPQHLPLTPEPEAEKVDLRHQMMDERKKAEQWMLDYAVQHIVTKLTPARKRRVAMLVEAFEAVVPLPEF